MTAAARKTLFAGGLFRVGITSDDDRFDFFVVFLVGFVFVGFEIGSESTFGERLRIFVGGTPSRTRKANFLHRARLQVAQSGAGNFAERGAS